MNILDRLVIKEFFRLFVLFLLASPVLFILGDLTDNLDTYLDRGYDTGTVVMGYIYQMPLFISWGLPVAALIATIFTVNTMTRHSEVAAAKAGGISFFRLYAALPIIGLVLTVLGLVLTELVPMGNRLRAESMGERDAARDFETTLADINERDLRDATRADSPLAIADDAVVIYKSVGSALQDLTVSELCLRRARERGFGRSLGETIEPVAK